MYVSGFVCGSYFATLRYLLYIIVWSEFFVVLPMIVAVSGPDIDIGWCFLFCLFCFCLLFTFVSPRACNQILLVYGLCAVPDHFLELHLVSGSLVLDLL